MTHTNTPTQRYLTVLNDELGWDAVAEEDGDVRFTLEVGPVAWLSNYAPADPEYLQLITGLPLSRTLGELGVAFDPSDPADLERVFIITSHVTRSVKGAQASADPVRDVLEVTVEVVAAAHGRMPSVEHLAAILPRMRQMLVAGLRKLHTELGAPSDPDASSTGGERA